MTPKRSKRAGLVIIPAMVCLVVVSLIAGVMLRQATIQRKLVRDEERRAQCDWLVESGVARAAAQCQADPNYDGEVWAVELGEIKATVKIGIEDVKDRPDVRLVRVAGEMPRADEGRVRATVETTMTVKPESTKGPR